MQARYEKKFSSKMKKALGDRRKHCALAVITRNQKFSPRRRPPSRGAYFQNLYSHRTRQNCAACDWSPHRLN